MNVENLRLPNNWVCVQIDDSNEYAPLGDDKIKIDTSFEPEKNAQTKGIIVKACEHLSFNPRSENSYDYDVDIEVLPGDTVVFHFMAIIAAKKENKAFVSDDGKTYAFLPYDRLFVAVRDGKIIPLNGVILVRADQEKIDTRFEMPQMAIKNSKTNGTVVYAGMKCRGYAGIHKDFGPDPDINVGDKIVFKTMEAIPLQYEYHSILERNLYRMHRKDVLAIVE